MEKDPDVVDLKVKHYQARLVDTVNRVLDERREVLREKSRLARRQSIRLPDISRNTGSISHRQSA